MASIVSISDILPPQGSLQFSLARSVARAPEVDTMIAAGCVVAVGVSGGKDSVACALAVARYLKEMGHSGPRLLIHADLGEDIEWRDSLKSCERLAEHLGWELIVFRRAAGGLVSRWQTRWASNVQRYINLECVKLLLPFSTPNLRFCTSELKTQCIFSGLRKRFPAQQILNVTGVRRQESTNRSRMPIYAVSEALSRKKAAGATWNAIIDWRLEDSFGEIESAGLRLHEAYTRYGTSRVSCVFCIMSSWADLLAAAGCVFAWLLH